MRKGALLILGFAIVGLLGVLLFMGAADIAASFARQIDPLPPAQPGDPDLAPAFADTDHPEQAATDAQAFGRLCGSIARKLAWDGTKQQPWIRTGAQLDTLRIAARDLRLNGVSFGQRYPKLPEAVGVYMDAACGNYGGPLTTESRLTYVRAFEALSRSARRAAE